MIEAVLKVLAAGLSLWDDKEKGKYQDKFLALKKAYHDEFNKPDDTRSDAVLDNISWELGVLCDSFSARVGGEDGPTK